MKNTKRETYVSCEDNWQTFQINQDSSFNDEVKQNDVTFADVASAVANLNKKIHQLRDDILELKNCCVITVTCNNSLIEKTSPLGSSSDDEIEVEKNWEFENFISSCSSIESTTDTDSSEFSSSDSEELFVPCCNKNRDELEVAEITEEELTNYCFRNNCNDDIISDETLSSATTSDTSSSYNSQSETNCCSDKFEDFNTTTICTNSQSYNSNKCSNPECYGRKKRLRKRFSRGVQTLPKKRHILKFKFNKSSKNKNYECNNETCLKKTNLNYVNNEKKNSSFKSNRRSTDKNRDEMKRTSSNYAMSDKSRKKTTENFPIQSRRNNNNDNNNNMNKKNYNRKYDFSLDGTNIEIVRKNVDEDRERNATGNESRNSRDSGARRSSRRNEVKSGRYREMNKINSLSSEEQFSNRNTRESDKINEPSKTSKRRRKVVRKNYDSIDNKGANFDEEEKSDIQVKTAETKVDTMQEKPQEKKNQSLFKWFSCGSRQQSETPSQESNKTIKQESLKNNNRNQKYEKNETISKQLDARRNDIADVKKRLDVCISDLNDIITNLSKVFQQVPVVNGGPAGEGASQQTRNTSRHGRSRT